MKVVPHEWKEVSPEKWITGPQGKLRLQLTGLAAIFIEQEGVEVCVTFDHKTEVTFTEPYRFKFSGKGLGYVFDPHLEVFEHLDEVFTNEDMIETESGHMQQITAKLRQFKLETQHTLGEIRRERAILAGMQRQQTPAEAVAQPAGEVAADDAAE